MKILYITYIDFGEFSSGSSVRPQKMYKAFLNEGHELILLQTQQNKRRDRIKAVREVMKRIENESIDGCYIESPSGPIFNFVDIQLIKKIRRKNIPISFFYRDAYWLFAKSWLQNSKLKNKIIEIMHIRDIKCFQKNVTEFYMPSKMACKELTKYYSFNCIKELPPGADRNKIQDYKKTKTAIYVGASSVHYGTNVLVNAYKKLNAEDCRYNLIIVTRKEDWEKMFSNEVKYNWLEVYHVSGDEKLKELYSKADLAILPQEKNYYTDMAYSIKMMEYISYGKPIIANNLESMGEFIKKNNCGIIFNGTEDGLRDAVIKFYKDEELQQELYKSIKRTCVENSWETRVKNIIKDFDKQA